MSRVTRINICIATLCLLSAASSPAVRCALAGEAKPPGPPDQTAKAIGQWIEALGDPKAVRREEAYRQLARLGLKAISSLRLATYHRQHEVRWRAERLLGELIPAQAWNEKARQRLKAASVTIQARNAPLETVLSQIQETAGIPVQISPHLKQLLEGQPLKVNLEVKDYGAELALNRVLDDHKLGCSLVFNAVLVEGGHSRRNALLEKVLSTRIGPFDFQDAPLRDALGQVSKTVPSGMALDPEIFEKEARKGFTISLKIKRPLRLETVLAMLLDGHDLGYAFDERRLFITSKDRSGNTLQTGTFALETLVKSLEERLQGDARHRIVTALKESVDCRAWGRGIAKDARVRWKGGDNLIVRQRRSTLAKVTAYLDTLKRVEGLLNTDPGEDLEF